MLPLAVYCCICYGLDELRSKGSIEAVSASLKERGTPASDKKDLGRKSNGAHSAASTDQDLQC